jgi:hypothetical protein
LKKRSLVNLSVLLVSFLVGAFLLEVASRLLFEVLPSVVIENRSDPEATVPPLQERKNVTLKDGRIFSKGVPEDGHEYFAKADADLLLCEVIWG